jgi:hypothetical protein
MRDALTTKSPSLLAQSLSFRLLDLRKSCFLSSFPFQSMHVFSRLAYGILGHKQGAISFPLRCLSLPQTVRSGIDARITGRAVEHARGALGRCGRGGVAHRWGRRATAMKERGLAGWSSGDRRWGGLAAG